MGNRKKRKKQQGKPGKKRHKYQFFPPKVASFAKRNVALHKHAFKAVTIHVPHIAHIRVCHTGDVQQPVPVYFPARQAPVHHVHAHTDARPHLPQEIPPVGFHKNTKKSGSPVCLLQDTLSGCSVSPNSSSRKLLSFGISRARCCLSLPIIKKSSTYLP